MRELIAVSDDYAKNRHHKRQWTAEVMDTIYARFEKTVNKYGLTGILDVQFGRALARELRDVWEGHDGAWVDAHTQLEDQSEVLAKVFADHQCLPWCIRASELQRRIQTGEAVPWAEQRPVVRLERARYWSA